MHDSNRLITMALGFLAYFGMMRLVFKKTLPWLVAAFVFFVPSSATWANNQPFPRANVQWGGDAPFVHMTDGPAPYTNDYDIGSRFYAPDLYGYSVSRTGSGVITSASCDMYDYGGYLLGSFTLYRWYVDPTGGGSSDAYVLDTTSPAVNIVVRIDWDAYGSTATVDGIVVYPRNGGSLGGPYGYKSNPATQPADSGVGLGSIYDSTALGIGGFVTVDMQGITAPGSGAATQPGGSTTRPTTRPVDWQTGVDQMFMGDGTSGEPGILGRAGSEATDLSTSRFSDLPRFSGYAKAASASDAALALCAVVNAITPGAAAAKPMGMNGIFDSMQDMIQRFFLAWDNITTTYATIFTFLRTFNNVALVLAILAFGWRRYAWALGMRQPENADIPVLDQASEIAGD